MNKQEQIRKLSRLYGRKIAEKEYREINKIVTERKSNIKKLLGSGALEHFSAMLRRYYNKKTERDHLLNEYADIIISNVKYIKALNKERKEQKHYLDKLKLDLKRIGRIKTGRKNVNKLADLFKIKLHIAKCHSNFRFAKKTDYGIYALVFYLSQLFNFQKFKYDEKQELITSIIVFFELSSAVCYEKKREKDFLKYYPATIENKAIIITKTPNFIKKSFSHKKCDCFKEEDNGYMQCMSYICVREEQNVVQRLKRSKELFNRELASKEFMEYKKKRLAEAAEAIQHNKVKDNIPAKLLSKKFLEKKIMGQFIYKNFLASIARHRSHTDIYIDDLAGILRENNIAAYHAFEFYKALDKDNEFSDIFKVRFHLPDTEGNIETAFKTAIPSPVHSH